MTMGVVPNQAANNVTKEYLRNGVLPAPQNGTLFSVYQHPMSLRPIADPYEVPTGAVAGDVGSA